MSYKNYCILLVLAMSLSNLLYAKIPSDLNIKDVNLVFQESGANCRSSHPLKLDWNILEFIPYSSYSVSASVLSILRESGYGDALIHNGSLCIKYSYPADTGSLRSKCISVNSSAPADFEFINDDLIKPTDSIQAPKLGVKKGIWAYVWW